MDLHEMKVKYIGMGVRRMRYEQKLNSLIEKDPVEIGNKIGLNRDESIMLAEIINIKVFERVDDFLEVFENQIFSRN